MGRDYPTGPLRPFLKQMSDLRKFRNKNNERFKSLTEREVEVLTLLAEGMNNPAVAEELDISRATVQNHRASIRDKLNIGSQADFIKYGLAFDLIQL